MTNYQLNVDLSMFYETQTPFYDHTHLTWLGANSKFWSEIDGYFLTDLLFPQTECLFKSYVCNKPDVYAIKVATVCNYSDIFTKYLVSKLFSIKQTPSESVSL